MTPLQVHIHHRDKDYRPLNGIENVGLAHQSCNDGTERESRMPATTAGIERESHPKPPLQQVAYSSQEGADHQSMRQQYNRWLRGQLPVVFDLLLELRQTGMRGYRKSDDIATQAAWACQAADDLVPHSSKTYRVYVKEDVAAGIFEEREGHYPQEVRFTKAFVDVLVELGAVRPEVVQSGSDTHTPNHGTNGEP
jgi:hypothetical protein